jgi:hypothetical protein
MVQKIGIEELNRLKGTRFIIKASGEMELAARSQSHRVTSAIPSPPKSPKPKTQSFALLQIA